MKVALAFSLRRLQVRPARLVKCLALKSIVLTQLAEKGRSSNKYGILESRFTVITLQDSSAAGTVIVMA
jgi:hypothetical protein